MACTNKRHNDEARNETHSHRARRCFALSPLALCVRACLCVCAPCHVCVCVCPTSCPLSLCVWCVSSTCLIFLSSADQMRMDSSCEPVTRLEPKPYRHRHDTTER